VRGGVVGGGCLLKRRRTDNVQSVYTTRVDDGFRSHLWDVGPELLKGPRFRVDEKVPTTDLVAQFTLRSDFGDFPAHGREMLRIRVTELAAIEQLDATSETETFLKAAGNAGVRPVQSAANIVMNPVETAKGVPAGLGRFYDRMKMGAQHISEAGADSGKSEAEKTEEVTRRWTTCRGRSGSATLPADPT
jgi:hypothetical protein